MKRTNLKIDPKLQDLLPPLSEEEEKALRAALIEEGRARSPIIVDQNRFIVDGMNRYRICRELKLDFVVHQKTFASEADRLQFARREQLGRRNLSPQSLSALRAALYEEAKGQQAGSARTGNAAAQVAAETGVHPGTVKRDARLQREVKELSKLAATEYHKGGLTAKDVSILVEFEHPAQDEIVRTVRSGEADSVTKAVELFVCTPTPPPELTTEDRMIDAAKTIRRWCNRLTSVIDELPDDKWIQEETTLGLINDFVRSAARVARSRVGSELCVKCNGKGCKFCRQTGWLPKHELDQLL